MTNDKKTSDSKKSYSLEELRKYAAEEAKKLFKRQKRDEFDEHDLASGSKELLEKSDSELFPDETEEYTKEERRPKVIVDNKGKDKR
jgi:hypothetical protein